MTEREQYPEKSPLIVSPDRVDDRMGLRSQDMLQGAFRLLQDYGRTQLTVADLTYALITEGGEGSQALRDTGMTEQEVKDLVDSVPVPDKKSSADLPVLSKTVESLLIWAADEAKRLNDQTTEPEHIIIAALRDAKNGIFHLVQGHQVSPETLAQEITLRRHHELSSQALRRAVIKREPAAAGEIEALEEMFRRPSSEHDS